jgi:DNA ligase-1
LQNELKAKSIVVVPTACVKSYAELDELNGQYLNDGYEGQMVRTNDFYRHKRTDALLKRKEFQDDEFEILDIVEGVGNRTGVAGFMCFQTKQKTPFKASIKGSFEYCEHLLKNKKKYIGSEATVKYFNLTPDNKVPRFPVVIAIRNYE